MITISSNWGTDLAIGPSGDIATSDIESDVGSRVIRRLLTTRGDYIWHASYGAGLGNFVGEAYLPSVIVDTVQNQLRLEQRVAASPEPTVAIEETSPGTFSSAILTIIYQIAGSGITNSLALPFGI